MRWHRRIERIIGEPIWHAAGSGDYWHWFVTMDHRHGFIHCHTHEVRWDQVPYPCHTSCQRLEERLREASNPAD